MTNYANDLNVLTPGGKLLPGTLITQSKAPLVDPSIFQVTDLSENRLVALNLLLAKFGGRNALSALDAKSALP